MRAHELLLDLIISITTVTITLADFSKGTVDSDPSFQVFCVSAVKGEYTRRTSDHSETGDLCKIKYTAFTEDQRAADRFCKIALPYRIHAAKNGTDTICTAESLIVCPPPYQQIDGQCFLLVDELDHHTYEEAVEICKKKNATIARISKTTTSAYWTYYWPELSMVWVNVTDEVAQYSVLKEGKSYAIVFSMAILFRRRRNSVVQIDGKNRGQVMCEKESRNTGAFVMNKMKKFGEIFYGNFLSGTEGYFQTSNRYGRTYGDEMENHKICEGIAKPFSYKKEEAYIPTDLSDVKNLFGEKLIVARSVMTLRYRPEIRNMQSCSRVEYEDRKSYGYTENQSAGKVKYDSKIAGTYYDPCDAQWSYAYIKVNDTMVGKRASDAMRAHFLCRTHVAFTRYDSCGVGGGSLFRRDSGEAVCHQFFNNHLSWYDAQSYCENHFGGYLSGFSSEKEYKLLLDLVDKNRRGNSKDYYFWIGGQQTKECQFKSQGSSHQSSDKGRCQSAKGFEWANNVSPNGRASVMEKNWYIVSFPLVKPEYEVCLSIFDLSWSSKTRLGLNGCRGLVALLCQKPATVSYA